MDPREPYTSSARRRWRTGAVAVLGVVICAAPWSAAQGERAQNQVSTQVMFVAVADAEGAPVTDLSPQELVVQWDGLDCDTFDLAPFNLPVRVTVFVDNAEGGRQALQHMREGLKDFVDAIPAEVEVGLVTLARQPRWVARHTADRNALRRGIDLIVPDAGTRARFRDALVEEAVRLHEDPERQYLPVIVLVASDGPEGSMTQQVAYEEMVRRLIQSSATVHTLMFSSPTSASRAGLIGGQQVQVALHLRDLTHGTYEALAVASGFRRMLPELGRDIARKHRLTSNQYRVTYLPPAGTFDRPFVSVATSRPRLNLFPTTDGNVP
jgi:hypothetical protein